MQDEDDPDAKRKQSSYSGRKCKFCSCEQFKQTLAKLSAHRKNNHKNTMLKIDRLSPGHVNVYVNNDLEACDLDVFLTFCQRTGAKNCSCFFGDVDLLERLCHFMHNVVSTSIVMLENWSTIDPRGLNGNAMKGLEANALSWSIVNKEKLINSLCKILQVNLPMYVSLSQVAPSVVKMTKSKDCTCSLVPCDTSDLIQLYCQASANSHIKNLENISIELVRNICLFINLNGLNSIRLCFSSSSASLPFNIAHNLLNIIANIRVWLNSKTIEEQILPWRKLAIKYMCDLSDRDLRLASANNTNELVQESFKMTNNYPHHMINSPYQDQQSSQDIAGSSSSSRTFKIDVDGLNLAYKYFTSSTLTMRLCGVAQMNVT